MKKVQILNYALILSLSFFFFQCTSDDVEGMEDQQGTKSEIEIEITDAPIDNANISGVFVTVAEIKLDGETYEGFSGRKTIDVYALQNGRTEVLGLGEMDAKTYSSLTLVLDADLDDSGNSPGCYVMTTDGFKDDLYANVGGMQEIVINKSVNTTQESRNKLVIDFDLRKTIDVQTTNGNNTDYEFNSNNTMNSSIRLIKKNESGSINGNVSGNLSSDNKIVVYAFKKGTYNQATQANSSTEFSAAITSCNAESNGDYTLSFLEEGEYEIICASYEDSDNDGQFEYKGTLALDILLGLDSSLATVNAESNTSLNINIAGVLSL